MTQLLEIDGSFGEGGGQVLRASLAFSMALGKAIRVSKIRERRPKPGLKRQHLTSVLAAAEICGAEVAGAEMNSTEITFRPGPVRPGEYRFDIGSDGSCALVLQAVLPPLLTASGASRITVTGGTHNPKAPPFEFLQKTLLPALEHLGPRCSVHMEQAGFAQVGGGSITLTVEPVKSLLPLRLWERGEWLSAHGRVLIYNLDLEIARREHTILRDELWSKEGWPLEDLVIEERCDCEGPGNAVLLEIRHAGGCTVCSGFGQRGVSAEAVGRQVVQSAQRFLRTRTPVDQFLADQLIVPMALAGGGAFRTGKPSSHTRTCLALSHLFTGLPWQVREEQHSPAWIIEMGCGIPGQAAV